MCARNNSYDWQGKIAIWCCFVYVLPPSTITHMRSKNRPKSVRLSVNVSAMVLQNLFVSKTNPTRIARERPFLLMLHPYMRTQILLKSEWRPADITPPSTTVLMHRHDMSLQVTFHPEHKPTYLTFKSFLLMIMSPTYVRLCHISSILVIVVWRRTPACLCLVGRCRLTDWDTGPIHHDMMTCQ